MEEYIYSYEVLIIDWLGLYTVCEYYSKHIMIES